MKMNDDIRIVLLEFICLDGYIPNQILDEIL